VERRETYREGSGAVAVRRLELGVGQSQAPDPVLMHLSYEPLRKTLKINAGEHTQILRV
jgi:hypothetical protein